MKTFGDLEFRTHPGGAILGIQGLATFDNGFGVSVVKGQCTRGGPGGRYELGVFHDGHLHYQNPVAQGDVCGYLTEDDVTKLMAETQRFDSDVKAVERSWVNEDEENQ